MQSCKQTDVENHHAKLYENMHREMVTELYLPPNKTYL